MNEEQRIKLLANGVEITGFTEETDRLRLDASVASRRGKSVLGAVITGSAPRLSQIALDQLAAPVRSKPNSFYKQQEIKRLSKQFQREGVTKARARVLARIWYAMSPEQRAEVMRPGVQYDESTKKVVK